MKTILIIYTDSKITNNAEIAKSKKYSFNTDFDLKEGDLINSPTYSTNMQVVKVLSKKFKYYNSQTGKMSNIFDSTMQWEIRPLIIRENLEDTIYGSII